MDMAKIPNNGQHPRGTNTYSDNIFAVPNNYSQSLDKLLLQELGQIVV